MNKSYNLILLYWCSPNKFNIEPLYKDLGVLYDLAIMLKDADIAGKTLHPMLN